MRANLSFLFASVLVLTGCGPSKTELAKKERARLELEEQQLREAERANKAITEMNKKLGRKPPTLNWAAPTDTKTALVPAPEKSKQP
jgi:hypothetical protein